MMGNELEWEGRVHSICDNEFTAYITYLGEEEEPDLFVTILMSKVPKYDLQLVQSGAFFNILIREDDLVIIKFKRRVLSNEEIEQNIKNGNRIRKLLLENSVEPDPVISEVVNKRFWDMVDV